MKKIFTFMLSAAALLVSSPSWAHLYPDGEERNFKYYNLPLVPADLHGEFFGTICLPERIVATQGINIYDVVCVDKLYNSGNNDGNSDTTKVARLVVDVHTVCYGYGQDYYDGHKWTDATDEPFCPYEQGTGANTCDGKVYIDWAYSYDENTTYDYRMKAGAAYFYNVCDDVSTLEGRKIWVDKTDSVAAPVCQNGFYGTLEQTKLNEPVTVLTQATLGAQTTQYLEQVTQVTIPANRGYFKGNFECVPWRWNTDGDPDGPEPGKAYPSSAENPLHYPCSNAPAVPRRVSSNAIAFNVGPRDAVTGLYPIDLEHPIYLNQETNKRIENGQLIIEAADGTKYNAFGQKLR